MAYAPKKNTHRRRGIGADAIRPYGFMLFPHPLFLPKKGLPDMNRVRFATSEGLAGVNRVIEPLQGSLASHT